MRRSLVALALFGCTSSATGTTISGDGGSGGDGGAVPRVIVSSQVSSGTHPDCTQTGALFTIGSFGDASGEPSAVAISDGATVGDGVLSVSCTVKPEGDGFSVDAEATLTGSAAGAFKVSGHFTPSGDQTTIFSAVAARSSAYAQSDCVARYTQPIQSTAAGRVWADLDCENATDTSKHACKVVAQFRFENCKQD
jgi:hypothetical protein